MTKTLTVEGDLTAADTRTLLTTQGSVTAPSLVVPAGVSKIDKLVVAATAEGLAAGSNSIILRLGGAAVQGGEQVMVVGATGTIAVQAGSDAAPQLVAPSIYDQMDIAISPSDTISISGEMAGSDTGTVHICVTLVFA